MSIFDCLWRAGYNSIDELQGKTLKRVELEKERGDTLVFETVEGEIYAMFHQQDCCENVNLEDVCGDLEDLVGSPILLAEEVTNTEDATVPRSKYDDCFQWTFYKLATNKGAVTLRWYGESNGYYSMDVTFAKMKPRAKV